MSGRKGITQTSAVKDTNYNYIFIILRRTVGRLQRILQSFFCLVYIKKTFHGRWIVIKKRGGKKKNEKRIFSFVLALLVMLSIMPVSAMAAESTGWDGTSKTEPATDGDGVYLISTAEELYWFATKTRTSATKTISGRLISDIDLNNQNWQNKEMGGSQYWFQCNRIWRNF